jgi:hypothetical protein
LDDGNWHFSKGFSIKFTPLVSFASLRTFLTKVEITTAPTTTTTIARKEFENRCSICSRFDAALHALPCFASFVLHAFVLMLKIKLRLSVEVPCRLFMMFVSSICGLGLSAES